MSAYIRIAQGASLSADVLARAIASTFAARCETCGRRVDDDGECYRCEPRLDPDVYPEDQEDRIL
jgi:hypothetical protein